jgi:hypothetical protein
VLIVGWKWCNITYGKMSIQTSAQLNMSSLGSPRHDGDVEICTLGGVPHVLLTSLAHEGRT